MAKRPVTTEISLFQCFVSVLFQNSECVTGLTEQRERGVES